MYVCNHDKKLVPGETRLETQVYTLPKIAGFKQRKENTLSGLPTIYIRCRFPA